MPYSEYEQMQKEKQDSVEYIKKLEEDKKMLEDNMFNVRVETRIVESKRLYAERDVRDFIDRFRDWATGLKYSKYEVTLSDELKSFNANINRFNVVRALSNTLFRIEDAPSVTTTKIDFVSKEEFEKSYLNTLQPEVKFKVVNFDTLVISKKELEDKNESLNQLTCELKEEIERCNKAIERYRIESESFKGKLDSITKEVNTIEFNYFNAYSKLDNLKQFINQIN